MYSIGAYPDWAEEFPSTDAARRQTTVGSKRDCVPCAA